MKIVHLSDWHGKYYPVPEADLYICTGDMLKNYPKIVKGYIENFERFGLFQNESEEIIPAREIKNQTGHIAKMKRKGSLRKFLGNKEAQVIVVPGNHDFVYLKDLFGEPCFEITEDSTRSFEFRGLKIGGFRGITKIIGEWNDELDDATLQDRVEAIPADLDIIVSHAPPWGIMDEYYNNPYGVKALAALVQRRSYTVDKPSYYFFGHCHHRSPQMAWLSEKIFCSNAATGHNIIELEDEPCHVCHSRRSFEGSCLDCNKG